MPERANVYMRTKHIMYIFVLNTLRVNLICMFLFLCVIIFFLYNIQSHQCPPLPWCRQPLARLAWPACSASGTTARITTQHWWPWPGLLAKWKSSSQLAIMNAVATRSGDKEICSLENRAHALLWVLCWPKQWCGKSFGICEAGLWGEREACPCWGEERAAERRIVASSLKTETFCLEWVWEVTWLVSLMLLYMN